MAQGAAGTTAAKKLKAGRVTGDVQRSAEMAPESGIEVLGVQVGNQSHVDGGPQRVAHRPFPVECLPAPLRQFVVAHARAMDCDESLVALPALTVLATCLTNVRRIQLSSTWYEPAVLWTAIVADSGDRKSPPLEAAVRPLWFRQDLARENHVAEVTEYREKLIRHRNRWAQGVDEPLPEAPAAEPERYLVGDVSIEQLAALLSRQRRGVLVCRDELDGWLKAFDASRGGKGGGPAHWLEFHGGRPLMIDRFGGTCHCIHVPAAAACITGGIQPEILAARLTKSHLSSGLFARLLFAYPPPRQRNWTETEIDRRIDDGYSALIRKLLDLPYGIVNCVPVREEVLLASDARSRFARFVREFGRDQHDADPALTASFAKLEGYAARFALVLHLTRWAGGEAVDPTLCDVNSVEQGITLSHWFANEARRVRALLCETPDDAECRRLVAWVHRRGGRASARDLSRSYGKCYSNSEQSAAALDRLVAAGFGEWTDVPAGEQGRHPARMFQLSETASSKRPTKCPTEPENQGLNPTVDYQDNGCNTMSLID